MIVLLILYDLHLPYATSLKEKRHIISSVKDKLRAKLNVSIAEVDYQNTWQRCRLAAAWVGTDTEARYKVQNEIDKIVSDRGDVMVTNVQIIDY